MSEAVPSDNHEHEVLEGDIIPPPRTDRADALVDSARETAANVAGAREDISKVGDQVTAVGTQVGDVGRQVDSVGEAVKTGFDATEKGIAQTLGAVGDVGDAVEASRKATAADIAGVDNTTKQTLTLAQQIAASLGGSRGRVEIPDLLSRITGDKGYRNLSETNRVHDLRHPEEAITSVKGRRTVSRAGITPEDVNVHSQDPARPGITDPRNPFAYNTSARPPEGQPEADTFGTFRRGLERFRDPRKGWLSRIVGGFAVTMYGVSKLSPDAGAAVMAEGRELLANRRRTLGALIYLSGALVASMVDGPAPIFTSPGPKVAPAPDRAPIGTRTKNGQTTYY